VFFRVTYISSERRDESIPRRDIHCLSHKTNHQSVSATIVNVIVH
jgi:hypothetical protein